MFNLQAKGNFESGILEHFTLNLLYQSTGSIVIMSQTGPKKCFIQGDALTLKWSRGGGFPMSPKIRFRALARKREVTFHRPSMTLSNFRLRFFWW